MRKLMLALAFSATLPASLVFAQDMNAPYRYRTQPFDRGDVTGSVGPVDRNVPASERLDIKWEKCARLYPSFDPRTGTFIGEDGRTHICQ